MTGGRQSPAHSFCANLHSPGCTHFSILLNQSTLSTQQKFSGLSWSLFLPEVCSCLEACSCQKPPAHMVLLACSQGTSYPMPDNTWVTGIIHPVMQGSPGSQGPWAPPAALVPWLKLSLSIRPCAFSTETCGFCRYVWLLMAELPLLFAHAWPWKMEMIWSSSRCLYDNQPFPAIQGQRKKVGFVSPNTDTAV